MTNGTDLLTQHQCAAVHKFTQLGSPVSHLSASRFIAMANYLAKTNTPRPDWVAGDAVNIDSPDLTNNFLTAAGLSAAVKEPKLTDQTNEGVLPHLRHVKTGTYARNGYTNGAAYNPQMNTTSNQLHLSRHYQSGIRNTWGQPKQSCAANTNWAGANETSMPASAEFWGAPSSRAFKLAMGTQSRATPLNGATRSPHMQSNDFTHTTHPHIRESFVPAAVNPTMRTLEVLEPKVNGIKGNFDSTGKLNHDKSGRKKKEYAPGPIEQHSPDLTSHRVPRPDKNYEGSSPSLPSSVSTINISDTGLAPSARRNQSVSDIRSTIGLKPNIHQSGNTWLQYNWAHPQGKDDDEVLQTDSYLDAFIFAWRSAIPGGLLVKFNQENANQDNVADHWRCDINTDKGALLTPLAYPDTMVDTARLNQKLEWRRLNWTSSLLMRRRMGNQHGRKPPSHPKRMDWYCAPGGGQIETTEYVNPREIVEMIEPKIEMPEFNDFVPRIPSFLRPAEKYDMEAVRLIYNWEVQHGHQAMDSQPLEAEDLENILKTTQELGMPFIVAVRGSARELGLMNGNLSYSPYRQFPKDKLDPRGEKRGEILGFGFMSV